MAVNNSLVKQAEKQTFSGFMTSDLVKKKVNDTVGGKDGQRFITSIVSAVAATPMLAECDFMSIFSSAMLGESLKLSPSPQLGQYYLVPYNNNKTGKKEAQFQLGYKGYIQLAIRSGYYKKINVMSIKKGELIKYDALNEEIAVKLIEDDMEREETPTAGYYAIFEYHNGFKKALYWSKEKMMTHAVKYSQGYANDLKKNTAWTFWSKDFDAMAYKTMIRQLISKWGIMSIDMQQAIDSDQEPVYQEPIAQSVVDDFFDVPNDTTATETEKEINV